MPKDFDVGDFIVFQNVIIKVTEIKDAGKNEGKGYGVSLWLTYIPHWHLNNEGCYYSPLHISHFETISKEIKKNGQYCYDTEKISSFLKEALLWYLARSEYDIRELSTKADRVCEIPF